MVEFDKAMARLRSKRKKIMIIGTIEPPPPSPPELLKSKQMTVTKYPNISSVKTSDNCLCLQNDLVYPKGVKHFSQGS